jgi:hypothetical protein
VACGTTLININYTEKSSSALLFPSSHLVPCVHLEIQFAKPLSRDRYLKLSSCLLNYGVINKDCLSW